MGHDNLYPVTGRRGNRLSTPLGELCAEQAGEGELLLIRPETLDLLPGEVTGDNHLPAVVSERLYRGSHAEYRLEIGDTTLQATLNNRGRHLPEVGDRVTATVAPDDLVTLSE
jgi:spermidine/putrescine transport system ATP-binding protein